MRSLVLVLLAATALAAKPPAADSKPRVSFELLTRPGLSLTASQQWYQMLTELGVSGLQIHSAGAQDQMGISEQGGKSSPGYKVVGILAADNVLYLPGGKFGVKDSARLRKWLDNLTDQGAAGVTEERSAFGLLPRQLEQIHADLERSVSFSTQGLAADKAVGQIAGGLKFSLALESAARGELERVTVGDELRGLSAGTALAAIVRPSGLVLEPERPAGGELRYRIGKPLAGHEAWPVGWKPKEKINQVLPGLLDFLKVEISETPAADALAAIRGRLEVPLLMDHRALAQLGIDPTAIKVEVPDKRMTYSHALSKVLSQAKLKYELRVDEADHPLLWVTTIRQVP